MASAMQKSPTHNEKDVSVATAPLSVLFSMTTFFDFPEQDKWARTQEALDSIILHHPELLRVHEHQGIQWTWLLVNEFSAAPRQTDWPAIVHAKYPFVHLVEKDAGARGQAASLNIILRELKDRGSVVRLSKASVSASSAETANAAPVPYTYWVHWEESWVARRECIWRGLTVLQNEATAVSRVQMTRSDAPNPKNAENMPPDWLNLPRFSLHGLPLHKRIRAPVAAKSDTQVRSQVGSQVRSQVGSQASAGAQAGSSAGEQAGSSAGAQAGTLLRLERDVAYSLVSPGVRGFFFDTLRSRTMFLWPVYSLRPSVMRASAFTDPRVGLFTEDPKKWPWRFEHEFGERWELAGGRAAILDDAPVVRCANHHSISSFKLNKSVAEAMRVAYVVGALVLLALLIVFLYKRKRQTQTAKALQ